jgi:hypothetical protein
MTPSDYLAAIKERLITDPHILHFHIRKERIALQDGFLRARLTLVDNSMLEFAEYFQITERGDVEVLTYSFHWADAQGQLIKRWDNTPHFPELDGFPDHLHDGKTGQVQASMPMNLFRVLDIVTNR